MFTKVWMLIVLALSLSACSAKKANSVSPETPQIELTDATGEPADEFTENTTASLDEAPEVSADVGADVAAESSEIAADTEPAATEADLGSADDSAPIITADETSAPEYAMTSSGVDGEYIVQKNETLMMIAFKLYGDYGKWRDLANRNASKLRNGSPRAGMKLMYDMPSEAFVWNPQGNPHLIRTGETLGKISGQVYGTQKRWKALWDNNRPLIKDPNRIFAGFTLYWLDLGKVAQASGASMEL